jgi:hypothetical protein
MTPEEVKAEIDRVCRGDWAVELAPLADHLRFSDATETFHILFQWATHSQERGPAGPAAHLLWKINPRCPITCREAIQEMLTDWDISNKEVPFYLAAQFSVTCVKKIISELHATSSAGTS